MVGGEVAVGGCGGQALAGDVAVTRVLYSAVDLNIGQLVSYKGIVKMTIVYLTHAERRCPMSQIVTQRLSSHGVTFVTNKCE